MITFIAYGEIATAGSKKAFPIQRSPGKWGCIVTDDSGKKGKDWRRTVQHEARKAMTEQGRDMIEGAIEFSMTFFLKRPKSHYRSGKFSHLLKPTAPGRPIAKPDTTKLVRAVEDALTGIVWKDDSQVVEQINGKWYAQQGQQAHVLVSVRQSTDNVGGF